MFDGNRRLGVLTVSLVALTLGLGAGPAVANTWPAESSTAEAEQAIATNVVTGNSHSCALTDAGGVKCWGLDAYGEVGDGEAGGTARRPHDVTGLTSGVQQIVAGGRFNCALLDGGAVQCWGEDGSNVLGTNAHSTVNPVPVTIAGLPDDVVSIVAGQYHACALDDEGAVFCWGSNTFSQVGLPSGFNNAATPVTPEGLDSGVAALAAGHWHTCALLGTGSVKCWGYNARDQLGTHTAFDEQAEPLAVADLPDGVTALSAGLYHTCALTDSGAAWCWGDNITGQLGDDQAETGSVAPVKVPGISEASGLSAGAVYTCVVVGGGVKCWGTNMYGVLGDGTFTMRPHPVDVVGLDYPITQVDAGWSHTCAVTDSGGVRCWGSNRRFALGVRHPKHSFPTPVIVRGFRGADVSPT